MARYANILNDDAWKVVIFTPGNEDLMARMLEVLLPGKKIQSLVFRSTEQHGLAVSEKISNFDAVCTSDTGEMFIVEMQGLPQNSYADRMLCYASFPVRMQLEQKLKDIHEGKAKPMDYGLLPIYVVSFVNFAIEHRDEDILQEGLISRYCICSPRTVEVMTESLHFVFLELGRLKAKLDVQKQMQVSGIMRTELDRIAENNYAREKGLAEGKKSTAKNFRELGVDIAIISKATGLSEEEILAL